MSGYDVLQFVLSFAWGFATIQSIMALTAGHATQSIAMAVLGLNPLVLAIVMWYEVKVVGDD